MTSEEYLYKSIEMILDYIEKNLKSKIVLDDISNEVHISKYHLDRIFHAVLNKKLIEYARMRKLSSSLKELLETNLKVSDISREYGFEYEQSYIRAFKTLFGISPEKFRLLRPSVPIQEKLNLDYILKVDRGILALDPSVVLIPEFYLAGIRTQVFFEDDWNFSMANQRGNEFYNHYRQLIKNAVNPNVYIGLVEHTGVQFGYTHYTPSLQINEPVASNENICCIKVPTNKYVVFKYIGLHSAAETNISKLTQSLQKVITEWFVKSSYISDNSYHFEKIDSKISRDDYCEVEIYYPIKPKENRNVDFLIKSPVIIQ